MESVGRNSGIIIDFHPAILSAEGCHDDVVNTEGNVELTMQGSSVQQKKLGQLKDDAEARVIFAA